MRFDVIILGAGVVGLSTARRLAETGAKIALLDAHAVGGQGSRAAAGVAIPSVRLLEDAAMLAFTRDAKSVLREDLDALGGAALQRGAGILRLVGDAKQRDALEQKASVEPSWLGRWATAEELVTLEPALAGAPLAGGFVTDEGHMVDTDAYLTSLVQACAERGVDVRLSTAALEVHEEPHSVQVRTAAQTLVADRVVVAAGAWSGGIAGLHALPIKPQRGQMMTVFSPRVRLQRIVSGPAYLAPWRAGQVVVGATEEDAGFASFTTPAGLLHLCATVARLSPALREAQVTAHWAGLRSVAPGGRPLIGVYPGMKRVWLGTGHGGQGILTGGLTGRVLAKALSTDSPPETGLPTPTEALE